MKARESFLTAERRDFIQKFMLNICSITFAAAYANNFFTSLKPHVKLLIYAFGVLAFAVGLWIKKGEQP